MYTWIANEFRWPQNKFGREILFRILFWNIFELNNLSLMTKIKWIKCSRMNCCKIEQVVLDDKNWLDSENWVKLWKIVIEMYLLLLLNKQYWLQCSPTPSIPVWSSLVVKMGKNNSVWVKRKFDRGFLKSGRITLSGRNKPAPICVLGFRSYSNNERSFFCLVFDLWSAVRSFQKAIVNNSMGRSELCALLRASALSFPRWHDSKIIHSVALPVLAIMLLLIYARSLSVFRRHLMTWSNIFTA